LYGLNLDRHLFTPIMVAVMKKRRTTASVERLWRHWKLHSKHFGSSSKSSSEQSYDSTVSLLGIYPSELKACVHTEICT
jgi:hypothetical protein